MTIPTSNVSFSKLQSEFGGANPISLSEFYRNGGAVDGDDYAPNVPTSGTISLSQFKGAYDYTYVWVDPCTNDPDGEGNTDGGGGGC